MDKVEVKTRFNDMQYARYLIRKGKNYYYACKEAWAWGNYQRRLGAEEIEEPIEVRHDFVFKALKGITTIERA